MGTNQFRTLFRAILLVLVLTLACAGVARADSFSNGEFVTYGQPNWGGTFIRPGAALVVADLASVYAGTSGVVAIGLPSPGFSIMFGGASEVLAFLPQQGTPAPLTQSYVDPLTTSAGAFAGDVLALQFNVDFNKAGFLHGTSNILFGNLVLQNLTTTPDLNGLTISQVLADANTCLGGGTCVDGIDNLATLVFDLNTSFESGGISLFGQNNLALPGSVTPTPEPSSLLLLGSGLAGLAFLRRRFVRA